MLTVRIKHTWPSRFPQGPRYVWRTMQWLPAHKCVRCGEQHLGKHECEVAA